MKKLINQFYDVRQEEWKIGGEMFLLQTLLMVSLYLLKPARDSLFLSEVGPKQLPLVYLLLAIGAIPVSIFMSKYLQRYQSRKMLQYSLLVSMSNLFVLRWILSLHTPWVYMVFYIWVGIFSVLVISQFWLYANNLFDVAQSKRLFPFLNLGSIFGAIAGSAGASLLVNIVELSTVNLLYISIITLGLCWLLIFKTAENEESVAIIHTSSHPEHTGSASELFKTTFNSRYQLLIAGVIGIGILVSTLIAFQFKSIAGQAYPDTAALTSFMGYFYGGMSLVALVIQMSFSTQLMKRLGLDGAVLTRPVGLMAGSILLLAAPVLASAIFLEGFNRASRYSIDKTGRELLFLPMSRQIKQKTKIFIDTFVNRFFRGMAGLLLLLFIFVMNLTAAQMSYVVVTCVLIWIALSWKVKKEYVEKFRTSLRQRFIDIDSITLDLDKPFVLQSIREMLQGGNESRILYALGLLRNSKPAKLSDELSKLLAHHHSKIRLHALKLLQQINSVKVISEASPLLNDPEPEIRLEAVNYLRIHGEEKPEKNLHSCLKSESDQLKLAALGCTHKYEQRRQPELKDRFIQKILQGEGKDSAVLRAQIAQLIGYGTDEIKAVKYLPLLLHQKEPVVVREALKSMQRLKDEAFLDDLFNKLKNSDYSSLVQKTLAAYGEAYFDRFRSLFFDESTELEIRRRIPGIFAVSVQQSSIDYLTSMLKVSNPTLRYHALKALNNLYNRDTNFRFHEKELRSRLLEEARFYFELLSIKMVQATDIPNNILIRALEEKMEQAAERLFRISGLIHDQQDMYGSFLALTGSNREAKAAAIEFLDNILNQQEKKYLFPIVDTISEEEKLQKGRELFDLPVDTYVKGMMKLLEGDDLWLKTCTVFSISSQCPKPLQNRVQQLNTSRQPDIIQETAQYVIKRNKKMSYGYNDNKSTSFAAA